MTARKKATPEGPSAPPSLTAPRAQVERELRERVDLGAGVLKDLAAVGNPAALDSVRAKYQTWRDYNKELLRKRFSTAEIADKYAQGPGFYSLGPRSFAEQVEELEDDLKTDVRRLDSVIERLGLYDEPASEGPARSRPSPAPLGSGTTIFLVHGRDSGAKEEVARFLGTITELRVVILHEQPNEGRTIIEKFEDHAADAAFAIVLLTGDDEGGLRGEGERRPRPRQNVILELGFFFGRLGRQRVAALYEEGVELPSDLAGVAYTPLDERGAWKLEIAKELRAARVAVDAEKLL